MTARLRRTNGFTKYPSIRRFSSVFFLLLLLACPAFPESRIVHFENGAELNLVSYRIFPVTSLGVVYKAGADHEPVGKRGLAHLVEHLTFRGTPSFRIAHELERIGASFNALTLKDRVIFYETFPSVYLDRVLAMEIDRMRNAEMPARLVELEKRVVAEEDEAPSSEINVEDVRKFYREFYKPANLRIVLVGSFDFDAAVSRFSVLLDTKPVTAFLGTPSQSVINEDDPARMMLSLAHGRLEFSPDKVHPAQTRPLNPRAEYVRDVLPNGMRVLLFSHPHFRTLTVEGYVRAGTYFEGSGRPNLAWLTARMLTEIGRDAGISFSAASFNTYIQAQARSGDADRVLTRLAASLQNPAFTESTLSLMKQTFTEQIKRRDTRSRYHTFLAASRRFYTPGHPFYMYEVEKQIESVRSFSLRDVADFHKSYYRSDGTILVVAGSFQTKIMMKMIRDLFSGWPQVGPPPSIDVPRMAHAASFPDQSFRLPTVSRYEVFLSHPGLLRRNDPDYYACLIANSALGASVLSSRLGNELRDRLALVYEVRSEFFEATLGDGLWGITLEVAPEHADAAIDKVRDVVRRFAEEGIGEQEFEFHKSLLKGAFLVSLSIPLALAGRILDAELFGLRKDYVTNYGDDLNSVSREDVNRAIRRHFSADHLWAIGVGP